MEMVFYLGKARDFRGRADIRFECINEERLIVLFENELSRWLV
jgi:hypothetical protein